MPNCQDPNDDICTETIELGPALMFAKYDSTSREIYILKDKLTQDFEGEYLIKVVIKDGFGKTERNLMLTVACDNYQSMIKGKLKNQQTVAVN